MPFQFVLFTSLLIVAAAIAGLLTSRHFVLLFLSVELIFIASIVLLVYFFAFSSSPSGEGLMLLFAIWAIAAAETIVLITFYVFMKHFGFDFDVSKLKELKW